MNANFHSLPAALAGACLLALALAGPVAAVRAQAPAADPYAALARYRFSDSRQPLAEIEEQIRKSPAAGYRAFETRFIELLRAPDTTADAKRFICRKLALVGSAECVPVLAPLLTDNALSHPARMALETLPAPEASAALRNALPTVTGKLRAGVIASLGARRDPEAVSALEPLAKDPDPLVAQTAIAALGAIGTENAVRTLESLRVDPAHARTLVRARLTAAGHLAAAGQQTVAAGVYRAILGSDVPSPFRLAALKGLIETLPQPEAVQVILDRLQDPDPAMRAATAAAYADTPRPALQTAVAKELPRLKPDAQVLLLGVLADQPDLNVRAVLLELLMPARPEPVRIAALDALARHGDPADVPSIVTLAHNPSPSLADAARRTLERMGRPGINESLVKLIETAGPEDRAVVLAMLARRRVESALPTLVRLTGGADALLAAEAAKAIGTLGSQSQVPALAKVLATTDDTALRTAAAQAAQALCRRAPDKTAAAKDLLAALDAAATPAARIVLLQILPFTGGPSPLAAVVKALDAPDAALRQAAIRVLIDWPEPAAAPHLLAFARTTTEPSQAIVALRDGCLRLAQAEETPLAQRLDIVRGVLETARRPEEKQRALAVLAEIPTPGALDLLSACAKNPDLKTEASQSLMLLARQTAALYPQQALAALESLRAQATTEQQRQAVDDAIAAVKNAGQSPEGFILAWLIAGPFNQPDKSGSDLFNVEFPPEKNEASVDWRPHALRPDTKNGLLEFDKIWKGDNRVAYASTRILSSRDQTALLELGSDDGLKVWLNGKAVHSNNTTRAFSPAQDKVPVQLRQGANTLLLKITQDGGEWSVACRLCSPDGKFLDGVSVSAGKE
ncbi:MAG TPA: HEAT repeat domain-containing protein [Verrucomicrobiota bacterium]|nr:HEAT repeat domain-containing protein [Verrucomicrobiota bacterium]HNU52475.1 HEAT repeat domain-containing protein [Verrucomicrobiota bacterium]